MNIDWIRRFVFSFCISLVLMAFNPLENEVYPSGDIDINITQVDKSKFPQVTVYVSLTDEAGEPVAIHPGGIEIKEDGRVIEPDQILSPDRSERQIAAQRNGQCREARRHGEVDEATKHGDC